MLEFIRNLRVIIQMAMAVPTEYAEAYQNDIEVMAAAAEIEVVMADMNDKERSEAEKLLAAVKQLIDGYSRVSPL